jgi:hypothetical protein
MQVAKTYSDVKLRLTTADRVVQKIAYQALTCRSAISLALRRPIYQTLSLPYTLVRLIKLFKVSM